MYTWHNVRICPKERGTKFGVYGTKQHKSSTKFTVLPTRKNSLGTPRSARIPRCTHGINVRISHKGRGTKFGVYCTKQHKSNTKFWCCFNIDRSCHALCPAPFKPRLPCSYLAKSRPQRGCLPVTSSPPDSALTR